MTFEDIKEEFQKRATKVAPIGKKLKIVLDDQPLMVDGTGDANAISTDEQEADTTVSLTIENFKKIVKGDLNPMMAVMSGKVKVKGDMGLALKLKDLM